MSELARQFGVDWRLLIAQAVNFFLLFFLLKRFAYAPILAMLKKRKDEIHKGLEFRDEAEKKLQEMRKIEEATIEEANRKALGIVTDAEQIAKTRKEEILRETTQKSEQIVDAAKRLIEEEKRKMGEHAYQNAEDLIRSGITHVLGKITPEERDKALIQEALQELRTAVK